MLSVTHSHEVFSRYILLNIFILVVHARHDFSIVQTSSPLQLKLFVCTIGCYQTLGTNNVHFKEQSLKLVNSLIAHEHANKLTINLCKLGKIRPQFTPSIS